MQHKIKKQVRFTNYHWVIVLYFMLLNYNMFSQEKLLYLQLNDSIYAFKNFKQIKQKLATTKTELINNGYFSSNITPPIKINDSTFQVNIETNTQIKNIQLNTNELPLEIKETLNSKNSNSYNLPIQEIKDQLNQLNIQLANNGSPFNKIELTNIKQRNDSLFADLKISSLQKRKIDSIVIKGYPKFPKSFLKYYSNITPKQEFNYSKIKEKTENLDVLAFVKNKKTSEVLFNPNKTVLYLYLTKLNANNFDGFLGFSTNEETGKLILDGYLNLNLINNLNYGEELRFSYKSDSETQQQFSAKAKLPYIFKLPVSLNAQLSIFRQEEEFATTEQSIGLSYAITPKLNFGTSYKTFESADLNELENVVSTNFNYNSKFIETKLSYLKRNTNLLSPIHTQFEIYTQFGERSLNSTQQYKIGLIAQQVFKLNTRNSIFIKNNFHYLDSNNYIANELFWFGGISSIRGFEENSLRAHLYNTLNTEYRFLLNNNMYIHSIIDFGYLENNTSQLKEQLTSYGIGLAMITKAGLFKLNYANGTSSSIPFQFSNSKIHLSLTAFF